MNDNSFFFYSLVNRNHGCLNDVFPSSFLHCTLVRKKKKYLGKTVLITHSGSIKVYLPSLLVPGSVFKYSEEHFMKKYPTQNASSIPLRNSDMEIPCLFNLSVYNFKKM